jgi:tRNA 2-selenouridine synthase
VEVLEGGYRTWRRLVVGRLYDADLGLRLIRLDGYTGTAKTALLAEVAAWAGR